VPDARARAPVGPTKAEPTKAGTLPIMAASLLVALLAAGSARADAPDAGPAPSAAELRARARAVLADPGYQRAAPAVVSAPEPDAPGPRPIGVRVPVSAAVAPIGALAHLLFYVFLAVGLVLVLAWLARALLPRRRRGSSEPGAAAEPAPAAAPEGETSLAEALRLAAEGRYGEAVHALLLAAIGQLSARATTPPPPSRTSRELARSLPLKGDSRIAFAELVAAVERSLFGGAALGPDDFERGLARYRTTIAGSTGSAGAGPMEAG
jgi:uncharacterized protein DUF4129